MAKQEYVQRHYRVPQEVDDFLQQKASDLGVTANSLVNVILAEYKTNGIFVNGGSKVVNKPAPSVSGGTGSTSSKSSSSSKVEPKAERQKSKYDLKAEEIAEDWLEVEFHGEAIKIPQSSVKGYPMLTTEDGDWVRKNKDKPGYSFSKAPLVEAERIHRRVPDVQDIRICTEDLTDFWWGEWELNRIKQYKKLKKKYPFWYK